MTKRRKSSSSHPYLYRNRRAHGGSLAYKRKRRRRPVSIRKPIHLVLRSELAINHRSLLKHHALIHRVLSKYGRHFQIRIYEWALCSNHIHCLIKARSKRSLQGFMRVLAGQIAQQILLQIPLGPNEKKAFAENAHPKNHRTFWTFLVFSRITSWGRDFRNVKAYIVQNTKEALGLIRYKVRRKSRNSNTG